MPLDRCQSEPPHPAPEPTKNAPSRPGAVPWWIRVSNRAAGYPGLHSTTPTPGPRSGPAAPLPGEVQSIARAWPALPAMHAPGNAHTGTAGRLPGPAESAAGLQRLSICSDDSDTWPLGDADDALFLKAPSKHGGGSGGTHLTARPAKGEQDSRVHPLDKSARFTMLHANAVLMLQTFFRSFEPSRRTHGTTAAGPALPTAIVNRDHRPANPRRADRKHATRYPWLWHGTGRALSTASAGDVPPAQRRTVVMMHAAQGYPA